MLSRIPYVGLTTQKKQTIPTIDKERQENDIGQPSVNSFMTEVPIKLETSPLICSANQWTIFYMIGTSVMKELTMTILMVIIADNIKHRGYTEAATTGVL